jgi:hypothetical protein
VKITPTQRRALLIAVAVTLVVFVLVDNEDEQRGAVSAAAAPRATTARAGRASAPLPDIALDKLDTKVAREPVQDAFEPRSWEPPAPKVKAPPPPPPQAPPLPYTYMGKIMEGNEAVVFLAKQDRNYAVKQGETIDGTYRVDEIKGANMVLTYLPLDQKQNLAIGAGN